MIRYCWRDTLDLMLAEGDEDIQQLARKLRRLAQRGGAISGVEMDGFVAGLLVLPDKVSTAEWLPQISGPPGRIGCATDGSPVGVMRERQHREDYRHN